MRGCGVLLHISSLPSPHGIGTMGAQAYEFVDFLRRAGQAYWQILPLGPAGPGDSPYSSYSAFAGNPYFIDFDMLSQDGLLVKEDFISLPWGDNPEQVSYEMLHCHRIPVLRKAYEKGRMFYAEQVEEFRRAQGFWVEDYALYMALKDFFGGVHYLKWEQGVKLRVESALDRYRVLLKEDIDFWVFVQYAFFRQWKRLKTYANQKGISIIGDIPIYVAGDSADIWANSELFDLDEQRNPIAVAGCPPDAFSDDGQLWGNPLYRWDEMKRQGYRWWVSRIEAAFKLYDVVRIDHFRGFDSYYAIPAGAKTARQGRWVKGPGMDVFTAVRWNLGKVNIIAEDLGYLTDSVRKLVADSGFPGMKVLEFAFNTQEPSDYLPHNYDKNSVVYLGTHDNDTLAGWMNTIPREERELAVEYLRLSRMEGYNWGFIKEMYKSVSDTAIVQMQDFLGLGPQARMNTPSTVGNNWMWRMKRGAASPWLAKKIRRIAKLYGRTR